MEHYSLMMLTFQLCLQLAFSKVTSPMQSARLLIVAGKVMSSFCDCACLEEWALDTFLEPRKCEPNYHGCKGG